MLGLSLNALHACPMCLLQTTPAWPRSSTLCAPSYQWNHHHQCNRAPPREQRSATCTRCARMGRCTRSPTWHSHMRHAWCTCAALTPSLLWHGRQGRQDQPTSFPTPLCLACDRQAQIGRCSATGTWTSLLLLLSPSFPAHFMIKRVVFLILAR